MEVSFELFNPFVMEMKLADLKFVSMNRIIITGSYSIHELCEFIMATKNTFYFFQKIDLFSNSFKVWDRRNNLMKTHLMLKPRFNKNKVKNMLFI